MTMETEEATKAVVEAIALAPWWAMWVDPVLQLIGIVAAALIVVWQMGRQHKDNIKLQRNQSRSDLRLQIYREIMDSIEATQKVIVKAINPPVHLSRRLQHNDWSQRQFGRESLEIKVKSEDFINDSSKVTKSFAMLLITIERYEIAFPNFSSLRKRASELAQEISSEFSNFHKVVLAYLPVTVPEKDGEKLGVSQFTPQKPDAEKLKAIDEAAWKYHQVYVDALAYCMDLRIAAQNHLLSDLFDRKLPPRMPQDPKVQIYGLDEEDKNERAVGSTILLKS